MGKVLSGRHSLQCSFMSANNQSCKPNCSFSYHSIVALRREINGVFLSPEQQGRPQIGREESGFQEFCVGQGISLVAEK